ncbi:MAG: DUF2567 domain-containing protein [Micromonosporaceae bacterium]|nr:DUF2567 domain-containing protein [Micromonosporaceae bacterium]
MNAAQPWWSDAGPAPAGKLPGQRRPLGRPIAVAGLAAVALGVAVGQVWRLVAPRLPIVKVDQGQYFYGNAQPEQPVAAEGWLGLLGLVAGVLAAVAVWLFLRHQRGVAVLAALVLGSLVGGYLGWWIGAQLDVAQFETLAASAPVGSRLEGPLSLLVTDLNRGDLQPHRTAAVFAQALAAALTYTMLAGFAVDPDLRPYPLDEPEEGPGDAFPEPLGPPLAPPSPGLGSSPGLSSPPGLSWQSGISSAPGGPADPKGAPEPP